MPAPSFTNPANTLPERFYATVSPQSVKAPQLLMLNHALAIDLNLDPDWLASPDGIAMLAGNSFPGTAHPVAMAYAGHQFGHFTHQLGDGRALLIGEVIDRSGVRRDVQLKGSGRTPFSRSGDGRSALAPALREFLICEAMHALGIPTTRSLAVVATGERVVRETVQPGGISTRVAASHIRVGTFQFFAARGDTDAIQILCRNVIERHYPALAAHENPPLAMLEAVIARQAALIAKWMNIAFIHGVMNTDNMTVSGETIDYGPCAFMDTYDPNTVFSSIDHYGRYAYGNQPKIAHWNLARLAETLLPLLDPDPERALELATIAINRFPALFEAATTQGLRAKLGLLTEEPDDLALAQDLLEVMAAGNADYTLTFRRLGEVESSPEALDSLRQLFAITGGIDSWIVRWRGRTSREERTPEDRRQTMHRANPAIIPRNHLVEAALAAALEGNMAPYERLHAALASPYMDQPEYADLAKRPAPPEAPYLTFCGT
jgi:serine/tyrosine/threonine adenylyltransferase